MENLRKKLEIERETPNPSNQSATGINTGIMPSFNRNFEVENLVDKFESSSSSDNRDETNAADEHHHHLESSKVEKLEHSPFSVMPFQNEEVIRERDNELNELKLIIDSYEQESLLIQNRIKQLTVEISNLEDENIALRAAQNNENKIVINEHQSTIDDSVSQLNNSKEEVLNEYCLLEIFSYLSIDDMMQVKKVCKEWHRVSKEWFKRVQTLVYKEGLGEHHIWELELYEKYYGRKIYEKFGIRGLVNLISMLHSCGHHIKYYKVIRITEKYEHFIFQWISKLCKNIVEIDIQAIEYYSSSLNYKIIAKHWEKLEKIEFQYLSKFDNENFHNLLGINKQLKTVSIEFEYEDEGDECSMDDEFFTYLPTTIEKISLRNISIDNTEQLSQFISASKNFTSLKSLQLSGFNCLTGAVLAAIVNIKSLIHLSLGDVGRFESCTTINQIGKMKGLKSLALLDNYDLHENNVINIVQSCTQLESLRINTVKLITDRGLGAIVKLKNLKCLDINITNVTNKAMINLCDKLEILNCYYWMMNNSDAIEMLRKLTNLRYVSFHCCKYLTKDIIPAANQIANERKNNVLYVSTTTCGNFGDIDTPFFKHFGIRKKIPSEIFPDYIRDDMKRRLC